MNKTSPCTSKTCPCCARVMDEATWDAMPPKGWQDAGKDENFRYMLELKDCVCESTLAIEFKEAFS